MDAKKIWSKRDLNSALLRGRQISYPSYHADLRWWWIVKAKVFNLPLFLFWVNGMRVLQEVDMFSCLDHLSIMTKICCVVCARLIRTFSTPSENFVSVWNLVNLLFTQKTLLKLRIYHKYYLTMIIIRLYIYKYRTRAHKTPASYWFLGPFAWRLIWIWPKKWPDH